MSEFRYVMKRILGGIKLAFLATPIVLFAAGAIGGIAGSAVKDSKDKEMARIVSEFKETHTYEVMKQDKKADLDEFYIHDIIDEKEYANKLDDLVTDESAVKILQESDSYLKSQYNKCLKVKEDADIATYVALGSLGLGLISGAIMYPGYGNNQGIGYSIKYSAKQDFEDADYELFH